MPENCDLETRVAPVTKLNVAFAALLVCAVLATMKLWTVAFMA